MSDQNSNYLRTTHRFNLFAQITTLMLKGAGYAALLVLAIIAFVGAFYLIGLLLPPESKEAPDPVNRSSAYEYVLPEAPATRLL